MAAGTDRHVDQIFLRPGAQLKTNTVILQLSNPDLNRQLTDAELSMKKSEAELQVTTGTVLARVTNSVRLVARIHNPKTSSAEVRRTRRHTDPNVQNGAISVDLKFEKARSRDARTDLSASGRMETEKISQTMYVKYPLRSRAIAPLALSLGCRPMVRKRRALR